MEMAKDSVSAVHKFQYNILFSCLLLSQAYYFCLKKEITLCSKVHDYSKYSALKFPFSLPPCLKGKFSAHKICNLNGVL